MAPLKMGEMWTTMGSTIASFMFVSAIIRQYCPYEVRRFFEKYTHHLMGYFYPYIRISFHEFLGDRLEMDGKRSAPAMLVNRLGFVPKPVELICIA